MDAFALSRIQARAMRALVPAGIASGLKAVEHAFAAAGFQILEESIEGSILGGCFAKLYREASAVYVAKDASPADKALHLAHELGHLDLHKPNEECELHNTDLRPAGSRALSRVEAYGPRERRELQANVYGREFLLPRDLARKLFLEERRSASAIADLLVLPLQMVRQQLFDALLQSPVESPAVKARGKPVKLDVSQAKAVEHEGRALLVEAGPGSGKTKTLVARINWLLAKVHPSHILALTFSNKAAAELASRVVEDRGGDAVEVWTGTFHAFGLEIMRRHYDRLGLDPKIRLVSPSQAVEMLEEHLPLLGLDHFHDLSNPGAKLKEILKPISRAKDELIGPQEFRRLAVLGLNRAHAEYDALRKKTKAAMKPVEVAEKTLEAAAVYEFYDKMLRERKLVDFADLVMMPTLLMRSDPEVLAELRSRHREILVDEYQDVNRASAEMLKLLRGAAGRIWVVGDARQSIYRFRGASPLNMERFESDFPGGTRLPLQFNYRSTEHVTALCRTFAKVTDDLRRAAGVEEGKTLPYLAEAKREEVGSRCRVLVGLDDDCEADLVEGEIRRLCGAGVSFGRQTVLARTNTRLDTLAARLARHGIPVLHLGSFFERNEVRDILSILAIVAEPNGAALSRVAAFRGIDVAGADVARAVTHARELGRALAETMPDAADVAGLSVGGRDALVKLGISLKDLRPWTPAFEVAATWLLDRSDYLRHLAGDSGINADMSRSAVRQLVEFLDQVEPDGTPLTAKAALRRVRTVMLLADDRDLREPDLGPEVDAVRLMTVHAAKGLQFGAVHLVGLHHKGFPKSPSADQCQVPPGIGDGRDHATAQAEEERCCFFVAISRAEDHLRLYYTCRAQKQAREPSPFIAELGSFEIETLDVPSRTFLGPSFGVDPFELDLITFHDIRDFEKCPLRVAYRHQLAIRSRRHESPHLMTGGVIYELIDRASELADAGPALEKTLLAAFARVWADRGPPPDHPLAADYERVGRRSLSGLRNLIEAHAGSGNAPVRLPIRGGHVLVPPPIFSTDPAKGHMARMVMSGKRDTANARALTAGLFLAAARVAAGRPVAAEIAHLADGGTAPISRTDSELAGDLEQAASILDAIRAGRLEPKPQLQTCMRCGHFVSCPATGARPAI
jgi:superfamily I DNA/RNA helicase